MDDEEAARQAAAEATALDNAAKRPLAEQLEDKSWRVRKQAYEGMAQTARSDSSRHAELATFLPKCVGDSNQGAQDAACDLLLAFLEDAESSAVAPVAPAVAQALVAKTLNSRPAIVYKGTDALLRLVEHGFVDDVLSASSKAYTHKTPKVALAAVTVTLQALQQFGTKVVQPRDVVPALLPLFDAKDAKVRATAKDVVAELGRWLGADKMRSTVLPKLRPAQQAEIESCLAEQPAPPAPRMTRADRAAAAAATPRESPRSPPATAAAPAPPAAHAVASHPADDILPSEPVDVLAKLPPGFWAQVADAKWSERKEALSTLHAAASVPHAMDVTASDLPAALKRVIHKDSNAACVAEALACVAALAASVRKPFAHAARGIFLPLCFDKLKDKSAPVQRQALAALAAVHTHCVRLKDMPDTVTAALAAPHPQAKQHVLTWLHGAAGIERDADLRKANAAVLPPIVALTTDAVPAVRDGAIGVLAAFAHAEGGLAAISAHTAKLDERRLKQLEEAMGQGRGSPDCALRTASARPATAAARLSPPRPGTASGARGARPTTARATTLRSGTAGGDAAREPAAVAQMSMEEAKEFLAERFGAATASGLADAAWKARMAAMDAVLEALPAMDAAAHGAACLQALGMCPGWKDSNFQVLGRLCSACTAIAVEMPALSKADANAVLQGALEKLTDAKLKAATSTLLLSLAEQASLKFVAQQAFQAAATHKNPKVLAEVGLWFAAAVRAFGAAAAHKKAYLAHASTLLSHTAAPARAAGLEVVAVLHQAWGEGAMDALEAELKPATMATVRETCAKVQGEPLPEPTRRERGAQATPRPRAAAESGHSEHHSPVPSPAGPVATAAAPPAGGGARADMSGQITPELVARLGHAKWQERSEALDALDNILRDARGSLGSATGDLLPALKPRFGDTNRNLAAHAVQTCARLVHAMGPPFAHAGRILVVPILSNAGDAKPVVRDAVTAFISAYVAECGWHGLREPLAAVLGSPKCAAVGTGTIVDRVASLATDGPRPPRTPADYATVVRVAAFALGEKSIAPRQQGASLLETLCKAPDGQALVRAAAAALPDAQRLLVSDAISRSGIAAAPSLAAVPSQPRPTSAPRGRTAAAAAGQLGRMPSAGPATAARGASQLHNSGARAAGKAPARPATARPATPVDDGGPTVLGADPAEKERRALPPRSRKFETRPTEAADVQRLLAPLVSPTLAPLMFARDFQHHCTAAERLQAAVDTEWREMVSILDLLLRWAVLRFCDEKLQSVLRVQAFLAALLERMAAEGAALNENECNAALPCLCEKVGHKVDRVREGYQRLLARIGALSDAQRFVLFLMEGMECKNTKSRADCCAQLEAAVRRGGVALLTRGARSTRTAGVFRQLAGLVAERDPQRAAALGALMAVYEQRGERLWPLLGAGLPATQRDPIVERVKVVDAELARRGVAAGSIEPTGGAIDASPAEPPAPQQAGRSPTRPRAAKPAAGSEPFVRPATAGASGEQATLASAADAAVPSAGRPTSADAAHSTVQPTLAPRALDLTAPVGSSAGGHAVMTISSEPLTNAPPKLAHVAQAAAPPPPAPLPAAAAAPTPVPGPPPTPVPSVPTGGYEASWREAVQTMRDQPNSACIEEIKSVFYTIAAVVDGAPAEQEAMSAAMRALIEHDVDEVVRMLLARDLLHYNLAVQLKRDASVNPLRGLRYNLNCLLKVTNSRYAAQITVDTLTALMQSVLTLMCGFRALQDTFQTEGKGILQLLNGIASRSFDGARVNDYFTCLLRCNAEVPPVIANERGPEQLACYKNLVHKCLKKLHTQHLGKQIDPNLDVEPLLRELHRYFAVYATTPSAVGAEDVTLRTLKLVLHHLCRNRGWPLRDVALAMPEVRDAPSEPLLLKHIDTNLNHLQSAGMLPDQENAAAPAAPAAALPPRSGSGASAAPAALATAGSTEGEATPPSGSTAQPLQPSNGQSVTDGVAMPEPLKREVMECFQKIGTAATTTEGLEKLYDLLAEHPKMPVNDLLERTSEQFQRYIQKGIDKVHKKRSKQRKSKRLGPSNLEHNPLPGIPEDTGPRSSASGHEHADAGAAGGAAHDQYNLQERLKALEARQAGAVQ